MMIGMIAYAPAQRFGQTPKTPENREQDHKTGKTMALAGGAAAITGVVLPHEPAPVETLGLLLSIIGGFTAGLGLRKMFDNRPPRNPEAGNNP